MCLVLSSAENLLEFFGFPAKRWAAERGAKRMNMAGILRRTTIMALFAIIFIMPFTAFAAPTDPWQIFTGTVVPVLSWVGIVMVIFGAIEMGFAFRSDEAEPKRKGLMVAMSGAMLYAVCAVVKIIKVENVNTPIPSPDGNPVMEKVLNDIGQFIPTIGFMCIFWGVFELIKANKSDDAGGKQKALTIIVSGVCLWQIINLMKWVLGL